jgi:hypothetical protein
MKITKEEFKNCPNGTIFTLFLQGDDWDEEIGEIYRVVKLEDKLFVLDDSQGFFNINDMDDKNFEFSLSLDKVQNSLFKHLQ